MQERTQLYCALSDPYLRARELDLRDLRNQVLYHLQDKHAQVSPSQPAILVAKAFIIFFLCFSKGDSLSHSAIIAANALTDVSQFGTALLNVAESQS